MAICGQIFKIGFPFFLVQAATFIFNTVANTLLGTLGRANSARSTSPLSPSLTATSFTSS